MSQSSGLDPEIRDLLVELAGDASGQLLRATSRQLNAALYERAHRGLSSSTFLSKIENRLLEAHRNELGRLLYQMGIALLHAPGPHQLLHHADYRVPVPSLQTLGDSARHLQLQPDAQSLEPEAMELLGRCVRIGQGVTAEQALSAAMRVRPSPKVLRSLGMALALSSAHSSEAERLIKDSLSQCSPGTSSSYGWEALGWIACQKSDFKGATRAYERACGDDPDRALPARSWVASALQAGDREQLLRADRHMQASETSSTLSIESYLASLSAARQRGLWRPTPEAHALRISCAQQVAEPARRIIHAIA